MTAGDCFSGACNDGECSISQLDEPCGIDADCENENCVDGACFAANVGEACEVDNQCRSDDCRARSCVPAAAGKDCRMNSDCVSDRCSGGVCEPFGIVYSDYCDGGATTSLPRVFVAMANRSGRSILWANVGLLYYTTPEQPITDLVVRDAPETVSTEIIDGGQLLRFYLSTQASFAPDTTFSFNFEYQGTPTTSEFDTSDDYSAEQCGAPSMFMSNDHVLVCVKIGTFWYQVAGERPDSDDMGCRHFY